MADTIRKNILGRKLNGAYSIETLNAKINGSSDQVENSNSQFKNKSYTKKIADRSKISSQCQKYNMKRYIEKKYDLNVEKKTKEGQQIISIFDPYKSEIDDIFGYMLAQKSMEITKEEYESLEESKKKLFEKKMKRKTEVYVAELTKKRKSRLQMNALVNVASRRVEWEWNVASSDTEAMLYSQEVYSGVHSSIFNLDIEEIGKFIVSKEIQEFRDYTEAEAEASNIRDLTKEEKLERINHVLEALEYLSISGNQANYLTDTKPKFVILADYSWGNNAFQGVIKKDGLDVEMLKECIIQNEKYRLSNIYIGANKFFDDTFNDIRGQVELLKNELESEFNLSDFIKVSDVHTAFENYKLELKENLQV